MGRPVLAPETAPASFARRALTLMLPRPPAHRRARHAATPSTAVLTDNPGTHFQVRLKGT